MDSDHFEVRPQVQFQPVGTRGQALDFLRGNIDPGPVLVGTVDGDVPFGTWLFVEDAPTFKPQFACVYNDVMAWQQARGFKKSLEEAQELRANLLPRNAPRRRANAI